MAVDPAVGSVNVGKLVPQTDRLGGCLNHGVPLPARASLPGRPHIVHPNSQTLTNAPLYGPSLYDPNSLVTVPLLWSQEPGNILRLCLGVEPIVPSVGTHCVKTPPLPQPFPFLGP